jgi:AAA+ superfamily predicted ATPase
VWFKVEGERASIGQKFVVRCNSEIAGKRIAEERSAKGVAEARRTAEILASSLNVTATVYGTDAKGEFVFGVYEVVDGAEAAASPLIKRLFAESAAASLSLKDQLLANIPEDTIKGFASLAASLGYFVAQHKQIKRGATPQINYSTLFRIFCGPGEPSTISLPADTATIALLTRKLAETPGWLWLSDLPGAGLEERNAVIPAIRAEKVTINIDGELQIISPRTVFRGTLPDGSAPFMLIVQLGYERRVRGDDSLGLVYLEANETAVVNYVRQLLQQSNPFKNRVVLINRDLRTVRSRMSEKSWSDIIPHPQVRTEFEFITSSIRKHEMLKAEGLSIKRGLLLSGPPGDGKSTAIECFVNDIAGEASILIVEAVERIRSVYHLAQSLAPSVVILEDLDLMTKSRQDSYSYSSYGKDDVTGELLQVLSGGSAYADIITIATTNHPEAIDEALAKRAGRFDAHIRMGYPDNADKQRILNLYLDRFDVDDDFTRRRLQQTLKQDFGRLHLVPAHIEEFVKAGIKHARLAGRAPEYRDFEPGIDATKSIANQKPSA